MPSSEYTTTNEPSVNPLEPVEQLLNWLLSTTIHLAIGLAIGLIAARAMRSRHLRWTWAPVALAVVVLARSAIGGTASSALGMAALCATVRGRRWHREDLDAGADLAEIATERRGPLDAARTVIRRTLPRLLARIALKLPARWAAPIGAASIAIPAARKDWFRADRLIVGEEENGRPVSIALGGPTGGTHTLVVGAAGSGKTVTMTWMSVRSVEHGMGVIVLDPKGDRDLRRELRDAAHIAGRRAVHRAALPASGSALSRSRGTGAAQGRAGGQPAGARGPSRPLAAGAARADPARVRRAGGARLPGLAHQAPAERSDGRARPSGDHGRVRRRMLA